MSVFAFFRSVLVKSSFCADTNIFSVAMFWFVIFSVAAIVGLFYYWFTMNYKNFEKSGVPGPKPKFPWGNIPNMMSQAKNITYDYDDIYQ